MSPGRSPVVVDTNVFGAPLTRRSQLVRTYARHLAGRPLVIAAQTLAELRFGALVAGWGPARLDELDRRVRRAAVAEVDDDMIWEAARLRSACRRSGHPLAHKQHTGDLWIAAAATRYGLPLVAHDRVFRDAPGLRLITEIN